MNQVELKNKAILWLVAKSKSIKKRPHPFTPKEVAEAVGGSFTMLGGHLADEIVAEVRMQGIPIRYVNNTRPCKFELMSE